MATYKDWVIQQLSKLSDEDTRPQVLQELKDYLTSLSSEEFNQTAGSVQLPPVFDCLNNSNSEQVDLACDVLALCMNNLTIGESTNRYGTFLERALTHPFSGVKIMALTEIKRNIQNEDVLLDLCKRESLITNIVQCVGDFDLAVAKKACDVIKLLGLSSHGLRTLTSEFIVKSLRDVMHENEIVKFRVYELFIHISVQNEQNFNTLKSTGILNQLLAEMDNDDVLLRLNVLELLTTLAGSSHGYQFLQSSDILQKLINFLNGKDYNMIQLTEPGIIKFFGSMAHWKPLEILERYPVMFQRLFSNIEDEFVDNTIFGTSLDVLGHIGSTNSGKVALDSTGASIEKSLKAIGGNLVLMSTEIKVRSLNCLEKLFNVTELNNQITTITHKWFTLMDEQPIRIIWNYARNPFFELREAGLGVLLAISGQIWGQELIKTTPGLVEFLLDRNIEHNKECKEVKYAIIELLAKSQTFDGVILRRLQNYVKEGPFYVQTVTEVAIAGND